MKYLLILIILCGGSAVSDGQIAAGGIYTLDQSAIAAGGGVSFGGVFKVEGSVGQTAAGQTAATAPFSVHAGFWNPKQFAPTAATAAVGGRVQTANGRGIRNVRVTMTGASGEIRTAISTAFGYFQFADVPAGETYIFSAAARRFQFDQPTQIRTILEDTDDISFVAVENSVQNL